MRKKWHREQMPRKWRDMEARKTDTVNGRTALRESRKEGRGIENNTNRSKELENVD